MTRPPRPLFSSKPLWLAALAAQALKFSDQLFKQSASDSCSLLLNPEQIDRLIATAKATRAKSSSLALARYRSMHLVRPRATPGAPATHRAPTSRGWYAQVSDVGAPSGPTCEPPQCCNARRTTKKYKKHAPRLKSFTTSSAPCACLARPAATVAAQQ